MLYETIILRHALLQRAKFIMLPLLTRTKSVRQRNSVGCQAGLTLQLNMFKVGQDTLRQVGGLLHKIFLKLPLKLQIMMALLMFYIGRTLALK